MKKLVLLICFICSPLLSRAQDAIYVSGLLGMTSVSGTEPISLDTELSYGLRAGVLFNDHVAAGLFVNRYASDITYLGTNFDVSLTNILGEVSYYFNEADENGFWISGLLGVTQSKVAVTLASQDSTDTTFGASLGYHFNVAPNFSIGPQFALFKTTGDADSTEFSGMVNLTFWL